MENEEDKKISQSVALQWLIENGKDANKYIFVFPEVQSCPEGFLCCLCS